MVIFKKNLNFKHKILLVFFFIGFASIQINLIYYENSSEITISESSNIYRLKTSSSWELSTNTGIDDTRKDGWPDWEYAANNFPWVWGNGTWENPYIFENVTITNGHFIIIRNSQVPFIIRNCIVYNSSIHYPYAGILLQYTDNGQVVDNDCSNGNIWGIGVIEGENNTLSGNILNKNKDFGMVIYESDFNIILGNTMNYNERVGLSFYRANYNHAEGNEFINNHQGCVSEFYGCTGNVKVNNKCQYDFNRLFFSPIGIVMLVGVYSLPFASVGFFIWYKRSIKSES